jgi:hypothetical protein
MKERPKRIQKKRTKGWKMPEGAVSVTRPGKWGNPFIVCPTARPGARSGCFYVCVPTIKDAVDCFREMMAQSPIRTATAIAELRGKDLACWCRLYDKDGGRVPCHADVLLEIANQERLP